MQLQPRTPYTLRAGRFDLALGSRTLVVGILNCTPDSFSDGGLHLSPRAATDRFRALIDEGADLIDVGGESTRPGAQEVSLEEEWARVEPVLRLAAAAPIPVSLDTRHAEVARRGLDLGVSLINDVSALGHDPAMAEVVSTGSAGVVLMHMRGQPATMQRAPHYDDVTLEVAQFLARAARHAIAAGIERQRIVLDPGIGFGKTTEHNLELLRRTTDLAALGYPLLIGASRKRFIGALLGADRLPGLDAAAGSGGSGSASPDLAPIDKRLEGSLSVHAVAALLGAHLVRVHDVAATRRALRLVDALLPGA